MKEGKLLRFIAQLKYKNKLQFTICMVLSNNLNRIYLFILIFKGTSNVSLEKVLRKPCNIILESSILLHGSLHHKHITIVDEYLLLCYSEHLFQAII